MLLGAAQKQNGVHHGQEDDFGDLPSDESWMNFGSPDDHKRTIETKPPQNAVEKN